MPSPLHAALSTIQLLIADDRLVVREGLKRIVAECADMTVVGEASTQEEVVEETTATKPHVLLLDLSLGGPTLLGLIRAVKHRNPRCRVLVLNVSGQDPNALRIMGTGAEGYLSADLSRHHLTDAIRQVARGASYVSPSLARTLIASLTGRRPSHDVLSHREYQVLSRFGSGVSFKQIADELRVSPKTVSTYRGRILEKLKLKSNADIIRYAIEHHLVSPSTTAPPHRRKSTTHRSARP